MRRRLTAGAAPAAPYILLAALAYLPLLLARPGDLNADTKAYLYLDPAGLMERARSLWDPAVGGGTVTHQTIGYLWPMGPYYWAADAIGLPDWVAQRLWVGTIVFLAAAGTLALMRRLLGPSWLNVVGALAYGWSPHLLGHVTGQSALLLPFAAFPWLVLCMDRAVRERGWRWPAVYALIITTCGSLNGSSLFFVVVGSSLWPLLLARSSPGIGTVRAVAAVARSGVLTLATQLWWLVGYAVGGAYGLPLLGTTETLETTNATTSATEVLRGLGYWFFYGADVRGLWLEDLATAYMENVALLAVTFVIPVAGLALGGLVRWPHRAYFATLTATGLVMAVGSFDAAGRSPVGALLWRASRSSELVFSLRNTQRAAPLVVLGLVGLLVAGLHALHRRQPSLARPVAVGLSITALASLAPYWTSGLVAERFHGPSEVPGYWHDAADHLSGGEGRVLEIPGSDFAAYRWGNTLDPVSPGLIDRPIIARELVPMGSAPGVDLLAALDRSIQEGWFEPTTLAPVARLLGASDVLVRNDLEYERYRSVRPRVLWSQLGEVVPEGLGPPTTFGEGVVNRASPRQPMIDEVELGIDPSVPDPPALVTFPVEDAHPLVRTEPARGGTVLSGDGEGVLAAAGAGVLDLGRGPLRYAAELTAEDGDLDRALDERTHVILTDTNRLRGQHWFTLRENTGATEEPGRPAVLDDAGDERIPPIDGQIPAAQTVAEHRGAAEVGASSYGNPITLTPEYRPVMAFDGDPRTSWSMEGGFDRRKRIWIELEEPSTSDHVTLQQPLGRPGLRGVEEARVTLDGERSTTVTLDGSSFSAEGQRVALDGEPFTRLEVEITRTGPGDGPVGFGEIRIPGVVVDEVIRLPHALADAVGPALVDRPLSVVLSRQRANPADVVRSDPEPRMARSIPLPGPAELELSGTARLAAGTPGEVIDALVGIPGADDGGVTVRSRERLAGSLHHRASAAVDGRSDTAWRSPFGVQTGHWWEVTAPEAVTVEALDLEVLSDGRHSVPSAVTVSVDGGDGVTVALPEIADGDEPGATTRVQVPLPEPLRGRTVRLELADIAVRTTPDWYTRRPIELPVGLAEVRLPGVRRADPPERFDDSCRRGLVTVDGEPVEVRLLGSTDDALDRRPLSVETCGDLGELGPGDVDVRTAKGLDTGIDIDRLVFDTPQVAATSSADAGVGDDGASDGTFGGVPEVRWERSTATRIDATVEATAGEPFWLVVSESWNPAWTAHLDGVDLGEPVVHDAFGMGWYVDPETSGTLTLEVRWPPQRAVDAALALSALALAACAVLVLVGRRGVPPTPTVPWFSPTSATPARPVLAVLAAVAVGLLAASPPAALAMGVLTAAAALRWRATRLGTRLAPAAMVAAAATYVVAIQLRWDHTARFAWPEETARLHHVALAGPLLLAVLVWASRPATGPDDAQDATADPDDARGVPAPTDASTDPEDPPGSDAAAPEVPSPGRS